ncbi:MAG: RagB/SusD family nutrient uptake outer membrane protein [Candidatus Cryptobacteroides sp.]
MRKLKIYFISMLSLLAVAGCNLDQVPGSAINTGEAMESVQDCDGFRNGLYAGLKSVFTGALVYCPDLQTDCYHAVKNFGNWSGEWYHYSVLPSTGEASTAWFGLYSQIANANFLIEGTQKLLDRGTLSKEDAATVQQYYGEACYIRAHMYYNLLQYFCEDYEPETADEVLGVPVVTVYNPTPDSSKYPSRPSLSTTYAQILTDLEEAEKFVTLQGSGNSGYVTADVVTALQARVALAMHDYGTALSKARSLIECGRYSLISDASAYAKGWINDSLAEETIWQIIMTGPDDLGSSYKYFINNPTGKDGDDNPQYVPEQSVLDLYQKTKDIRYNAYFETRDIKSPVIGKLTLLVKYPGNPLLFNGTASNYCNMPKVFRLSEMYLIAAEAAAMEKQEAAASKFLNDLRRKRISGYTDGSFTGATLMREIREERVRELFGEGFRMQDLKRWHIGFQRDKGQNSELLQPGERYLDCKRPADDPYFLWPIPTAEIQANPQMQQNPAYVL